MAERRASLFDVSRSFVPKILGDFLTMNAQNQEIYMKASSFFIRGVCLIVDISGFTALSEAFCDAGKNGIDGLQVCTNGYMGELVSMVHSHGGDIIKFAGDALVCIFTNAELGDVAHGPCEEKSDHRVAADVALRAILCANSIRHVKTDRLTVHVGMSCGEMCFGILGGVENRWECLISGPCIHELSDCLDDAPSMQAVMTKQCADILFTTVRTRNSIDTLDTAAATIETSYSLILKSVTSNYEVEVESLKSGNFRIVHVNTIAPLAEDDAGLRALPHLPAGQKCTFDRLIRQFVPAPIVEELDSATGLSYFAEIREVVTMFMKWDSYDAIVKHRDLLELQPCFYQAQRILHASGAYLRQFLVDDKGCVLIACWGMPNMSYLDNAHRALAAAAQIRSQFEHLRMETSVGITCATVYCGTVGSMERMEYAAIGSEVNMAARLMGKAKGRLLVSESAYSRLSTSDQASLQAIAPMMVKGRTEPLQAYSYVYSVSVPNKSASVDISPACEKTLHALLDSIATAGTFANNTAMKSTHLHDRGSSKGSGKIFSSLSLRSPFYTKDAAHVVPVTLINGKDGTGKSSVAAWLRQRAAERGVSVVSVRLQNASGSRMPHSLWKKVFYQLTTRTDSNSLEDQLAFANGIIHEAFPNMAQLTEHVSLSALSEALGIGMLSSGRTAAVAEPRRRLSLIRKPAAEHDAKHMRDAIIKILVVLLNQQPALLIIENVHLADERSLDLLVHLLPKLSHPSAVVLTAVATGDQGQPEAQDAQPLLAARAKTAESAPWYMTFQPIIAKRKALSTLALATVSQSDLSGMLCTALGGKPASPELLQLVQDFSGGSYFWVREILQFIKEHGAEQFLSAVGEETPHGGVPDAKAGLQPSPLKRGASMYRSGQLQRQRSELNPVSRTVSFQSANSQRNVTDPHHSHLDKLLLVRFGGLPVDAQRILRTASVIGVTLGKDVLLAVLPRHLKAGAQANMDILLQHLWLFKDPDDDQQYAFAHPHAQQIIYELTPSSERNHLYVQIARHVEELHGDDLAYFTALSHYYSHCDTEKALQYVAKAVTALLIGVTTMFEFAEAVELLISSLDLCKTTQDTTMMNCLLNSCTRSIEQYTNSKVEEPQRGSPWYFALCLNRTSRIRPDAYDALSAPEQQAREAYLTELDRLHEELNKLAEKLRVQE